MEPRRTRFVGIGTPVGALVVVAGTFLLRVGLASASSSSSAGSTSRTVCESERSECLADDVCNTCLSGPEPTDFCSERYPSIFHSGSAGEGAGFNFCEATGASYCCDFVDEETSIDCLTNPASISLWSCTMVDEGCVVSDMPCYSGEISTTSDSASTDAPTPAATDAPTTPAPSPPADDTDTPTAPTPSPLADDAESATINNANRTVITMLGSPQHVILAAALLMVATTTAAGLLA